MSLRPAPERSARDLAATLAAQTIISGLTLALVAVAPLSGPFSVGVLSAAAIVTLILSAFGAWLEWNRDPLAEGFALAAALAGFGTALLTGLSGLWFVAPAQAVVSFIAGFALAERLIVRSESIQQANGGQRFV